VEIVISCPKCAHRYRLSDSAVGKKAKCKQCGEAFVISVSDAGVGPRADAPMRAATAAAPRSAPAPSAGSATATAGPARQPAKEQRVAVSDGARTHPDYEQTPASTSMKVARVLGLVSGSVLFLAAGLFFYLTIQDMGANRTSHLGLEFGAACVVLILALVQGFCAARLGWDRLWRLGGALVTSVMVGTFAVVELVVSINSMWRYIVPPPEFWITVTVSSALLILQVVWFVFLTRTAMQTYRLRFGIPAKEEPTMSRRIVQFGSAAVALFVMLGAILRMRQSYSYRGWDPMAMGMLVLAGLYLLCAFWPRSRVPAIGALILTMLHWPVAAASILSSRAGIVSVASFVGLLGGALVVLVMVCAIRVLLTLDRGPQRALAARSGPGYRVASMVMSMSLGLLCLLAGLLLLGVVIAMQFRPEGTYSETELFRATIILSPMAVVYLVLAMAYLSGGLLVGKNGGGRVRVLATGITHGALLVLGVMVMLVSKVAGKTTALDVFSALALLQAIVMLLVITGRLRPADQPAGAPE
jgi:hypothetical protein